MKNSAAAKGVPTVSGRVRRLLALFVVAAVLAACSTSGSASSNLRIVVHVDQTLGPFDRRLLGTNVPAWLTPALVADDGFRALTVASGTTVLRLPGGSWSDGYDWSGCEMGDAQHCQWTWAMRPSDFIGLLEATGLPAIWTVSFNGTAQEAAAAVAFFNGKVDDDRAIGVDRNGRDWLTVGHWAQLRAEHGHPEPANIRSWEVGNEVYGAKPSAGPDCASWGWEDVWTCIGTDYMNGTADHDGYLAFRTAMRAVDGSIAVGAVGVGDRGAWSDWDNQVLAAGGGDIDFYVVHHYGSDSDPSAETALGLPRKQWPPIVNDVRKSASDHGISDLPIAVTEHNLVSVIDADNNKLMTTALNAFYLAETIGELAANGVTMANQWNLANGQASNGSDYGLVDATTHQRSPAYFALALWSRFGDERVEVTTEGARHGLVLYGGRRADGSAQLLVLNPSGDAVSSTISLEPAASGRTDVTADVVAASSLDSTDVTFNGSATPSTDLSEPPAVLSLTADGELVHDFPAYSLTLLRWSQG